MNTLPTGAMPVGGIAVGNALDQHERIGWRWPAWRALSFHRHSTVSR